MCPGLICLLARAHFFACPHTRTCAYTQARTHTRQCNMHTRAHARTYAHTLARTYALRMPYYVWCVYKDGHTCGYDLSLLGQPVVLTLSGTGRQAIFFIAETGMYMVVANLHPGFFCFQSVYICIYYSIDSSEWKGVRPINYVGLKWAALENPTHATKAFVSLLRPCSCYQ